MVFYFRYGGIPDFTHRSVQYLEKKAKLKSKFLDMRKPKKSKNTHIFFTEESEMSCKKNKTLKKVGLIFRVAVIHRFICSVSILVYSWQSVKGILSLMVKLCESHS